MAEKLGRTLASLNAGVERAHAQLDLPQDLVIFTARRPETFAAMFCPASSVSSPSTRPRRVKRP